MKKLDNCISTGWADRIAQASLDYKYQPELTEKLNHHQGDFTEITLLEIVLWKLNRYPHITDELLTGINNLRQEYSEEKGMAVLRTMLGLRGFDLPMASTVLRFTCPEHFQIIDQRAYRFIMSDEDALEIPHAIEDKIKLYLRYLCALKTACNKHRIDFKEADKIMYQLDKEVNADIPIH